MKCLRILPFAAMALLCARLVAASVDPAFPHLERRGAATQLVVDGKPFLVLGGETANTASSSLDYMAAVYPRLAKMGLNTVLVAIAWDWIEPEEGKFDFTLVDGMLRQARENNLRIGIVWFGSWKNGLSSFAPSWVKRDQQRFPRVRIASGKSVEILSVFGQAVRDADAQAFAALLRHVRENDPQHTVIMVQVENEVGILGDARDRLPAADAAFKQAVPAELTARLQAGAAAGAAVPLSPDLRKVWEAAGAKTSGTWGEVFGPSLAAEEIFQAWHYARFMEAVAKAGKAELPVPFFTNTWINQPEDRVPGDYPSGGPELLTLDVWRVGAPSIDLNCPDIYLPNFKDWCARYHRPDNPLFVPESRGDATGAANALYAIGAHSAIGYSPFGIDNAGRLTQLRADPNQPVPPALDSLPLPRAYALLRQMSPLILDAQSRGAINAVILNADQPKATVTLGNYAITVDLRRNRRNPKELPELGYALVVAAGPDEYFVAGAEVQVVFKPSPANGEIVGFAGAEAGEFVEGKWKPGRQMNGDDILLRYDIAAAADDGESGSGLRFFGPSPTVQRVTLYRYR